MARPGWEPQLGLDIPILPVDVYGSGTWFLPDCDDCKLKGWSLGVALRPFLFPVARPLRGRRIGLQGS